MAVAKAALLALLGPVQGREEQTTTGNVGAVEVPFGRPLRQTFPSTAGPRRRRKRLRIPTVGAAGIEVFEVPDDEEMILRAQEQLELLRR
jgi:hypothetical protein